MKNNGKVNTFIGFAIKSGKYKIGGNAIQTLKNANLIIVCDSASDNSKKQAEKFANRFNCKLIVLKGCLLSDATHRDNAKIMAVTDENLAKAIVENSELD